MAGRGPGKTALVQSMQKLFKDERHGNDVTDSLFVAGKYDQQLSADPYSAVVERTIRFGEEGYDT
jgi:hypothetical protein